MPRDWNLPLTYPPKIEPVKRGECTQTIRFCTISKSKKHPGKIIRKQVGDRVRFYRWTGRPYWSPPEYIAGYMELENVDNVRVFQHGILFYAEAFNNYFGYKNKNSFSDAGTSLDHLLAWNTLGVQWVATQDFIDPPTGEALRDVLIGKNGKIPAEGAPAQILRWKP